MSPILLPIERLNCVHIDVFYRDGLLMMSRSDSSAMQFSSAILSPSGFLLVILIFSLIFLRKKTRRLRYLMSQLPQGPPPLPVVGNALDLLQGGLDRMSNKTYPYLSIQIVLILSDSKYFKKDLLQVLMVDWPTKYGEIFCSYIGPNWNVNISSPELMEV